MPVLNLSDPPIDVKSSEEFLDGSVLLPREEVLADPSRVTRGKGLAEALLARKRSRMADRLIPAWHRNGRVLDIGCGSFPLFLSQTSFRERHGIDRVPHSATEECSSRGINLVSQDLESNPRLPYPDKSFRVVTMLAVFEHLDPKRLGVLISEVRRVLEPGGLYVMTTPASWTSGLLRLMARLRLLSCEEIDEHKHQYRQSEIREVLTSGGFHPARVELGHFELFMNNWGVATK
jgi:ubiquinone/menaquinone biosynthesis C-methylase UbiE